MKAEPIRIVVADDELPIRQELVNFPWEKYGFCLSGAGRNGKDALEICRSEKPDVLLTDITMPVMDGLELIRTLKQEQPEIKCVILTCHQDFDYAKKAITYNALDYILKLDLSESILSETLKRIKEAVEQERKAKSKANIEHRAAFSRLISVQPVDREKLQNEMTRLRFGLNQDGSFCSTTSFLMKALVFSPSVSRVVTTICSRTALLKQPS